MMNGFAKSETRIIQHKHTKIFIPNLKFAYLFERKILHKLRIICRIISGNVGLNAHLFKIKKSNTNECLYCANESPFRKDPILETVINIIETYYFKKLKTSQIIAFQDFTQNDCSQAIILFKHH